MKKGYRQLLDEANAEVKAVTAVEAHKLQSDGAVIVDLRDPREVEREGRIANAKSCPRGMLEFWIDPESPYHKPWFSADASIVFYCASGWRSALAAKTAQDMGLDRVAHIEGGLKAWRAVGLPVEPYAP